MTHPYNKHTGAERYVAEGLAGLIPGDVVGLRIEGNWLGSNLEFVGFRRGNVTASRIADLPTVGWGPVFAALQLPDGRTVEVSSNDRGATWTLGSLTVTASNPVLIFSTEDGSLRAA